MESISDSAGAAADLKKARRVKPKLDRLPPHSIECEQGVLSCQLLDPNNCVNEVVLKLGNSVEAHYDLRHQEIQRALFDMSQNRQAIDLITLQQYLKDKQLLEQVGGIPYLSQLQDAVPSAANLSYYLDHVREKHLLRRMIQTCTGVVGRIYDYEGDVDALLDECEKSILSLRPSKATNEKSHAEVVGIAMQAIEDVFTGDGSITGLSTGLVDLDRATDGLHRGETICIAAYPGCGKSSLAMNIVVFLALRGYKVVVYSYEMKDVQMMIRAICAESHVNFYDVRDKRATPKDFDRMVDAARRLAAANIRIVNAVGMTIVQVQADARRHAQATGLDLAVIDHLQLVPNPSKETKEQEVSSASEGAKGVAMELNIPVIILSQLNDDGKLSFSRKIGQDAGDIWKIEPDGKIEAYEQPVRLLIEKGRDSVAGKSVKLLFRKTITRFECISNKDDEGVNV